MNLRDHLDRSPMTPYQWTVVALCIVLNALDGYDIAAMSFTSTRVQDEFALSGSQLGWLISATLIGMAVGAAVLGNVADRWGRRPTLLTAVGLATAGMLLAAAAPSATVLGGIRFVTGLGVGGILACVTVIITEYSNRRRRGLAMGLYTAGYGIGATLGGFAAVALQGAHGWRSVYLVGGLVSVVVLAALVAVLPESVHHLASHRPQGHEARLRRIADRLRVPADVDLLPEVEPVAPDVTPASPSALFGPSTRRATLAIWVAFFATMFGFYFVNSFTPRILVDAGMTADQGVHVGMALAIGGAVGSVAYGLLVARYDTARLLVLTLVASAAAVSVFVVSTGALAAAVVVGVVVGMLVNACVGGLYTVTPTLYPTAVRASGVGVALGVGRLGAILAPVAAGSLLDLGWTPDHLYLMVALVLLLGAAAAWLLPRPAVKTRPEQTVAAPVRQTTSR
ncbi:MFS transporter [Solicola sp. PLA-1-18]|uniref:MFS transporter n=1 Tax=Solicola sp. PLA-1-18 TaxID=3380532 RepID=UPI003B7878BC